jgi:hypothetical protein
MTVQTDRLSSHLDVLCRQIGPRPATWRAEAHAADYVMAQLHNIGMAEVQTQTFTSPGSLGAAVIPYLFGAALAVPLSWLGTLGKLTGGALLLGAMINVREFLMGKPPLYAPLNYTGESQNVFARIPARQKARRTLYLTAHLDTNKQRFMAPQIVPPLTRWFNTLTLTLGAIGGISILLDALRGRRKPTTFQGVVGAMAAGSLAAVIYDELQPYIQGANGNASGVAALLEIARILQETPLTETDVVILFTGAAETLHTGLLSYLEQHAPPLEHTTWINLDSVGANRLCYITRGGLSHFSEYRPGARITPIAAQVAREHPDLLVDGRPVTTLDESAALRQRGYEAICISSVDETGSPPHWNRITDTMEHVDPETIRRAALYTLALAKAIDQRQV